MPHKVLGSVLRPQMESGRFPIDIAAYGLSRPSTTCPITQLFELESSRLEAQLDALSQPFRERLMSQLGISAVAREETSSSRERGREAARQAVGRSDVDKRDFGLVIDYSTYAADVPVLWSLGHDIKEHVGITNALVLGARGSGCCGLHLALRTAQTFFAADSQLQAALLVASDRAPDGGRVCLPISVMSDAASALVVTRSHDQRHRIARLHAVTLQSSGRFVDVLASSSNPPAISIDAASFERHLMPLHFVALNRVLSRALDASRVSIESIADLIYPNTTQLDRQSACRALQFEPTQLSGPGPANLGHAFANDLIINAQSLFTREPGSSPRYSAWLAAGSGFTWGAAIIEIG